jgi:glycosyltransferase involved in cell wall biosynthesis
VKKPEWDFLHGKKITIISGYNDVAHNEICFINYFKKLVNTYNLNWRVVLENHCTYLDIIDSDIVIFSRSKTSNVKSVMDYCQVMKIPSIYMIDDNWVCIHKEWKEYENVIAPGTEIYDTFMYCIGKADITLLFNELLEQDLGDYAKRIFRTESNIDMQKGFCFKKSGKKDNIVLGYIGSHRTYTEPFQALSDILFKYNNTELVLMGTAIPKELENAPQNRIKHYPYIYDYQKYSNFVQNLKVDILIAPLGDTRFENSKCPNKYFEITSMGAVGIYSDIDIYRKYIKDGFNGFLCKNTLRDWKETIEMVINLRERYEAIFTNAVQDIKKKFDTQSRIDDFIKLLHMACQLVEERA